MTTTTTIKSFMVVVLSFILFTTTTGNSDLLPYAYDTTQGSAMRSICDEANEDPENIIAIIHCYGHDLAPYLIALATCESSLNPKAIGVVDNRDRGLYQINSYWNPSVDDDCAFDPVCSTIWTYHQLKQNNHWKWVSINNGCVDKLLDN